MKWVWDKDKSAANELKHGLSFESAQVVFDDPLAATRSDPFPGEARFQTVGMFEDVLIFVVHTWPNDDETRRIISARRASSRERKDYEDGNFS